nr:unnamed protein product [Callosobruchus chinensis]
MQLGRDQVPMRSTIPNFGIMIC